MLVVYTTNYLIYMQKHQNILAKERIGKLLWKFSLPAITGMLVQTLYNIVDTIFVGHGVGALGIAGLSIVFPVQMIIAAIGQMVAVGGASLISISLGAKQQNQAELFFGNSIFLATLLGIIITVFGLLYSTTLLHIFGTTNTILPYAKSYMDIILLGTIFISFSMTANNIVRAEGNAKTAMLTMILSAVLNTVLDPIFIFALHMGIRGAAIATVISQIVAAIYLLYYFLYGKSALTIHWKNLFPETATIARIFSIGIPAFIRISGASIATLILNHLLGFYGGDSAIAVFGILNRLTMFFFMPILGMAQGLQPIVGFNYGAQLLGRVKQAIKLTIIFATLLSVLGFVLMFSFPKTAMHIFTSDQILMAGGKHAIMFITPTLSLLGFQVVAATVFQSLGKALPSFILSLLKGIICLIPMLLILPLFLKLDGIWLSFPIADILASTVTLFMFIPQMRKLKGEVL